MNDGIKAVRAVGIGCATVVGCALVLVIVGGVLAVWNNGKATDDANAAADAAAAEIRAAAPPAPPVKKESPKDKLANQLDYRLAHSHKVEIGEFLKLYGENEIAADSKYKDMNVAFVGKVDDVKKDVLGNPYVTLGTGKRFEIPQVQCALGKRWVKAAATLKKGEKVAVLGRVSGLMMHVHLKECMILNTETHVYEAWERKWITFEEYEARKAEEEGTVDALPEEKE